MFTLQKREDCAILFMRELASQRNPQSIARFSRVHQVSEANTKLVARKLKLAGLIVAREGSGGGYLLSRDASAITFLDILTAVSGPLSVSSCASTNHQCDCSDLACGLRQRWDVVSDAFAQSLQRQTLAHIAEIVI